MKKELRPLGLYIHIPFCRCKCAYCDFYSLPGQDSRMDAYLDALTGHLKEVAPRTTAHEVDTIYFGGGTPSIFGAERLKKLGVPRLQARRDHPGSQPRKRKRGEGAEVPAPRRLQPHLPRRAVHGR